MRVSSRSRTSVLGEWKGVFRGVIGKPALGEYVGVEARDGGGVGIKVAKACGGGQAREERLRLEEVTSDVDGPVGIREPGNGLTAEDEDEEWAKADEIGTDSGGDTLKLT
jgi:hypothetical protein